MQVAVWNHSVRVLPPQNLKLHLLLGKVNVIPVHAMNAYTLSELTGTKEVQLIKLFR